MDNTKDSDLFPEFCLIQIETEAKGDQLEHGSRLPSTKRFQNVIPYRFHSIKWPRHLFNFRMFLVRRLFEARTFAMQIRWQVFSCNENTLQIYSEINEIANKTSTIGDSNIKIVY